MSSGGSEDPEKRLSDASSDFEDDDDDDEGEVAPAGYEPLGQCSDEEEEDGDGAGAAAAAIEPMETEQAEKIKNLMAGFSLPDTAVPEWAKSVPEDVWKDKLVESLHDELSGKGPKKREPDTVGDPDDSADQKETSEELTTSATAPAARAVASAPQAVETGSVQPERRRRISFSQDDEELIARVQRDVGLSVSAAGTNGDDARPHSETDAADTNGKDNPSVVNGGDERPTEEASTS